MRLSHFALTLFALLSIFAAVPASADDKAAITAVVIKATAAFDKGDAKIFGPLLAPSQSVIDDVPPHYWSGPRAIMTWNSDLHKSPAGGGIADPTMTLHASKFILVDGDRAWAPMPATFTYKDHGKPERETGTLTFALQKIAGQWKILGFAWARLT